MAISSALGSSALLPAGLGFRNVLINGGFDVWQRGTSITGINNVTSYAADRWCIFRSLAANYTLSRQAMVPSELSGFNYCARFQRTAGDTSVANLYLGRTFESITITPLAGKTVTLSFYARKGANFSGSILDTQIEFGGGTDLPFLTQPTSASVTNISTTLTTSWQYVTRTVIVPTNATAARILINYVPSGTAGAADYFEITGVQLEANLQPTPFEQRPIGVELQLCQRYFWSLTTRGQGQIMGAQVSAYGNACYLNISNLNPVPMRIAPTPQTDPNYPIGTYTPFVTDFNSNLRTITAINLSSPYMIQFVYNSTQLTANSSMGLNFADANRTLWLSAEL